jgi:hypothetical protein
LFDILEQPAAWMVRAGASPSISQGNLRAALFQAFEMSAADLHVIHIVKLPDDAVVLEVMQIHRLWWRLGLLNQ